MADPANVSLTQLTECFAAAGIDLGTDFVKLELHDDLLIVERLIRSPAGLPVSRPDGGVQTQGVQIPVLAEPPAGG
ncbi:hypothetical protein [Micromonospora aurantiaca (nom. illeg.)]|uniref:hypothetical protein n=1 Tax=Micromonospora aurantiaca (nom. illeg.) TaxID=47850 RepID=UPI0016575A1B|nr:hypothetical protein [Micromonospora aurantiaca]MBC9002957.1 hypothetical protein [Micromonospora aurantiaca]